MDGEKNSVFFNSKILHPVIEGDDHDKCNSELCDILQVSGVDLNALKSPLDSGSASPSDVASHKISFCTEPFGVSHSLIGYSLGISKTEMMQCARCRRFCCFPGEFLCSRCTSVIQRVSVKEELVENAEKVVN